LFGQLLDRRSNKGFRAVAPRILPPMPDSAVLFDRSVATLVESWAYLASGSPGAAVSRVEGAAVAAFVRRPEREVLNNAVIGPRPSDLDATLMAIERAYGAQGIEQFAVWAHEAETGIATALEERGYSYDSSTRTMAMAIDGLPTVDTVGLEVVESGLDEFWAVDDTEGLLPGLDPSGAYFYVARLDGTDVGTLMAFDHEGDCGIYMVGTAPTARRRGIATALSAHAVAAARDRGCTTASLQATEMAEGVYARVGFRDLGRWLEFVPG
jgi:GNAT superfamily N-acetyltransferase